MDVNDQSMLVNISMIMGCEVKPAVKQGENLKLEIKIDTMAQSIESPQGSSGGPINDVKGKSFNLIISPAGKSIDLTEASKVVYQCRRERRKQFRPDFSQLFSDSCRPVLLSQATHGSQMIRLTANLRQVQRGCQWNQSINLKV